jgi:hypothetical protein
MTETRYLGQVEVDSGTLVIGDPCYLLGRAAEGRSGVDYEAVLQSDDPVTSPLDGQPVVLLRQFGGDGSFPVFGEYEDGELIRVSVDFAEPDE